MRAGAMFASTMGQIEAAQFLPPPALDTAALMLGSDKSQGYCLEMICADFLAGHISR